MNARNRIVAPLHGFGVVKSGEIVNELVQLRMFSQGRTLTKYNLKAYDTLFEVIEEGDTTFTLKPFTPLFEKGKRGKRGKPIESITVPKDEVYRFQKNNTTNRNVKEEIYQPDYFFMGFIHGLDFEFVSVDYITRALNNLFTELQGPVSDKDSEGKRKRPNNFSVPWRQ